MEQAADRQRALDHVFRHAEGLVPAAGDHHARQMSAGGAAADMDAIGIDAVAAAVLPQEGDRGAHLAHDLGQRNLWRQPVVDGDGGYVMPRQHAGHEGGIALGQHAPVAAMDEHEDRARLRAGAENIQRLSALFVIDHVEMRRPRPTHGIREGAVAHHLGLETLRRHGGARAVVAVQPVARPCRFLGKGAGHRRHPCRPIAGRREWRRPPPSAARASGNAYVQAACSAGTSRGPPRSRAAPGCILARRAASRYA